jgi:hypothetical protein
LCGTCVFVDVGVAAFPQHVMPCQCCQRQISLTVAGPQLAGVDEQQQKVLGLSGIRQSENEHKFVPDQYCRAICQ